MSMYGVAVVIAPCIAPFFCGLIVDKHSWRNLFWLCLALATLQFLLYLFVVPETLWVEDTGPEQSEPPKDININNNSPHLHQHPISGHTGVAWYPWTRPTEYGRLLWIPSFYYGSLFAWPVGITIVMPQTFEVAPYRFATITLGCAFLALGIGGVLGKWSGGLAGDKVVAYFERKHGSRQPEDRLWAILPVLPFMLVSLLVVGLSIGRHWHWAVLLPMGGMYYFTLSAATGVFATYVLETYVTCPMDTQAVFQFCKMMWGFAVSFFAMQWGVADSFLAAYATQGPLACGAGLVTAALLTWKGEKFRMTQGMPQFEK